MADDKIGRAVLEIVIDDKQYKFALDQVEKDSEKSAKKVKSIWEKELDGSAFVKFGAVAATAVAAVGAGIIALGQRGADLMDVAQSFDVLSRGAGGADAVIKELRAGVVGSIPDLELMQMANKVLGAGMIKTSQDMGTLTHGARALAKATGMETKDAFDTLTSAIASGRTAQLKQLGLFVDSKVAIEAYARAHNKATGDLTDAERVQALSAATLGALRDRLKEIPPDAADFGEMIGQARARVVNFVDSLSIAIAQSPVLQAGMREMGAALEAAFGSDQQAQVKTLMGFVNGLAIFLVDVAEVAVEGARFIMGAWTGMNVLFNNVMGEMSSGIGLLVTAFHDWVVVAAEWDIPGARESLPVIRDVKNMLDGATQSFRDQSAAAIQSAGEQTLALDKVQGVLTTTRAAMVAAKDSAVQMQDTTTNAFAGMGKGAEEAGTKTEANARKIAETFAQLQADIAINSKVGIDKRLAELDAARAKEIAGVQQLKELTSAEYDQLIALIDQKYAQLTATAQLSGDEIRDRHVALQNEIALAEATGTQQRLLQIEFARQKEIEGLAFLKTNYGEQYNELVTLVNEKYAQMTAAATGHGLSVQQAAAAAGFKSRAELNDTAARAVETYNQMKASGLFTSKEIEKAWVASEVAKREAKGQSTQTFIAMDQALATGAMQLLGMLGEKNKAAAIAGAIINTYLAVTKAMASAPWPANMALAAGALAAGMAQVSKIRSSQSGGFKEGTPGLDFMNFGRESFHALHGDEAIVPRGGGHMLAGEIAASLPEDSAQLAALERIAGSLEDLPATMRRALTHAMQNAA
jgi:hypothetical protein